MNKRIQELAEQANKQEFCFDMNERIRELAEQAGLKFPSETAMSAELKIARAIEANNWADSVYRNLGTAQIYKAAIEKHFGVEE